ncbi:MAG: hypothetical protein QOJ29_1900 [Thermoleophilaceae bacterium]|nr:hypothetical protein [Thermoleophilaceae bacterium]
MSEPPASISPLIESYQAAHAPTTSTWHLPPNSPRRRAHRLQPRIQRCGSAIPDVTRGGIDHARRRCVGGNR